MYKSVGVFYHQKKFQLVKKMSAERGIWVKLKHASTGAFLWVGSAHMPSNETQEETRRLLDEFLRMVPSKEPNAVMLGDFNVQFSWRESKEDQVVDFGLGPYDFRV